MPEISVITVVKNARNTIDNCISSVLSQDHPAEFILVDGGSTDGTLDMIAPHINQIDCFVSEPDAGMYDALNKGIQMASGEVIVLLHSDDVFANQGVLSSIVRAMEKGAVDCCYGDLLYVDNQNPSKIIRYWRSGPYRVQRFYWGWMPPHPTFSVRKNIYNKYGLFNTTIGSAADYELMLRFLLRYGISCDYIPDVLVKMRIGGLSNSSLKNRIRANRTDRSAWELNGLQPYPWTLLLKPLSKIGQYFSKPKLSQPFTCGSTWVVGKQVPPVPEEKEIGK